MSSICLYFQVHQPFRLKDYSFFKIGIDHNYGATQNNYAILSRVSDLCYLPANELLLRMIEDGNGTFKVAFSISGTVLDQLEQFRPDVIESFQALAKTGCVEFLNETFYHSLAYLFSRTEFERQVNMHSKRIEKVFGLVPSTFRNTELIYDNNLAKAVEKFNFKSIIAEGVDRFYTDGQTNTNVLDAAYGTAKCILRNNALSDDIAFRFTDTTWDEYPLTPTKYATWLADLETKGAESINIFFDYETFGEHRKKETGIFNFLENLPKAVKENTVLKFATPTEIATKAEESKKPSSIYNVPEVTSWADASRDLAAWTADNMQKDALNRVYALEKAVLATNDSKILEVWGRLQTSDHFYYMSTKFWKDPVHAVFNPYKTPYDAYINYMNVITDFETVLL